MGPTELPSSRPKQRFSPGKRAFSTPEPVARGEPIMYNSMYTALLFMMAKREW